MNIPSVTSMLLCENVVIDGRTGLTSLINIFNTMSAPEFPWSHPSCYLFACMGDGEKVVRVELKFIDLENFTTIWSLPGDVHFKDKLTPAQLTVPLQLTFEHPGSYALELVCHGKPLGSYKVRVVDKSVEEPSGTL